jgi:hypothetical protein
MHCGLAVEETENNTYHCRLDGKFCKTYGEWEECRYNFPIREDLKDEGKKSKAN